MPITTLPECLTEMSRLYGENRRIAVRGQHFIKTLHRYLAYELDLRLSPEARRSGIVIREEAKLYGSHKPKDVDLCVIDPNNGPIMMIGCRSQMSSIGKNALTYYQDIVGECISLQDRFPMTVIGYVYLMPVVGISETGREERVTHSRYAKMYNAISGRSGHDYKSLRGIYDQFAYMVVDFNQNPPVLQDDLIKAAVPNTDLSITSFVDRMVQTYKDRNLFLDFFL